jgi:hypothetical protein
MSINAFELHDAATALGLPQNSFMARLLRR